MPFLPLLPSAALLLSLLGCRVATVNEPCLDDPSLCPACTEDAECIFMGNSCNETVDCAHRDADLAYTEIGCSAALEHQWPDDSACICQASVCQYAE